MTLSNFWSKKLLSSIRPCHKFGQSLQKNRSVTRKAFSTELCFMYKRNLTQLVMDSTHVKGNILDPNTENLFSYRFSSINSFWPPSCFLEDKIIFFHLHRELHINTFLIIPKPILYLQGRMQDIIKGGSGYWEPHPQAQSKKGCSFCGMRIQLAVQRRNLLCGSLTETVLDLR